MAQAYGIPMSLATQITMLLVLMVSSKGVAGVPRSSLVVVAAVLPMFNLPEAGLLLIMGIDHFLDMGRTATNVLGNAIATAVVAKWEKAIDPVDAPALRCGATPAPCAFPGGWCCPPPPPRCSAPGWAPPWSPGFRAKPCGRWSSS
jgi:hypothetical protein